MRSAALLSDAVAAGDPDADRIVYGTVIALLVIGVVLVGVGVWLFRQTRVDPELLAPLERMNDRSWSRRDPATQRRMLDEVRPEDAVPLHREPKEPTPDEEFDQTDRPVESFDDLKDPEPDAAVATASTDVEEPEEVDSESDDRTLDESGDDGSGDDESGDDGSGDDDERDSESGDAESADDVSVQEDPDGSATLDDESADDESATTAPVDE